jgi:hypothetical protein
VLLTSLATVMMMEDRLGVASGHAETLELVERYLRLMEGDAPPADEVPITSGAASRAHP